ncbi:MAG: nuclear transport factor 2 family protein [Burkholderiales bacterium]|jgi:ketosteroid isomerase-like protein|nr:nuclear transport factor 2 family protein [Burkholderiales bacterium]
MPSRSTVEAFIALVESGDTVAALRQFYAEDATMQENQDPPRVGLDALIAHEQRALAGVQSMAVRCVHPVLVNDEDVAIRWVFTYTTRAGRLVRFEELAWQRWRGEKIQAEQFFYDPAQMKAAPTS